MSGAEYLRELLRPLGVYDLEAPFNGGELEAAGLALDEMELALEEIEEEMLLTTAEDWGLERWAALFARRPVAEEPRALADALAALLRIGGDSFILSAVNDAISGCGIAARVEETGVGEVQVSFPGVAGVPEGFEEMRRIVEDILPAHLSVVYWFWYLTWAELEEKFPSWQSIEDLNLTWEELETFVDKTASGNKV